MKHFNNKARQAGMTLIELTVVLLVLVGLAGILIPYVSGFVSKTHDSTGASNIQAVNNAIQRYTVEHYDNFPNKLDSLIDGTTIYSKMMSSQMGGPTNQYLIPLTLTADQASSFTKVGITTLKQMDDLTGNATFNNTDVSDFSVVASTVVAEIDTSVITDLGAVMGKPVNTNINHYVVFGLGDDSSIAGETLSDVPVHFAQNANMGADKAYNHFTLVYEIPKDSYCAPSSYSQGDFSLDVTDEGLGSLTSANAETAAYAVAAPANQAACDTAQATFLATETATLEPLDTATSATFTYTDPGTVKAKFIGSAMAMGMGNFEGLGGALNRYYENTAAN